MLLLSDGLPYLERFGVSTSSTILRRIVPDQSPLFTSPIYLTVSLLLQNRNCKADDCLICLSTGHRFYTPFAFLMYVCCVDRTQHSGARFLFTFLLVALSFHRALYYYFHFLNHVFLCVFRCDHTRTHTCNLFLMFLHSYFIFCC